MVSLAFRKLYAGQVISYGTEEAQEMFIVWNGEVMVTEVTEFAEPLMKYSKGTAFNIYQIMMKK